MVKKSKSTESKTAYGKALATPIPFSYSWDAYENPAEMVAAKDELNLDEQWKKRNTERENKARQAAQSAAWDAAGLVKPTAENDPQIGLRDMVKTLLTAKMPDGSRRYTEEQAREMASAQLGVEWEE